jgi:hypothetical protein
MKFIGVVEPRQNSSEKDCQQDRPREPHTITPHANDNEPPADVSQTGLHAGHHRLDHDGEDQRLDDPLKRYRTRCGCEAVKEAGGDEPWQEECQNVDQGLARNSHMGSIGRTAPGLSCEPV